MARYADPKSPGIRSIKHGVILQRLKRLTCPLCGWRLIDAGPETNLKMTLPDDPEYPNADAYMKCSKCNRQIGIKKA